MPDVLTVFVPARAATSKLNSVLAKAVTAVVSACRRGTELFIRGDGVHQRVQQAKDRYALEAYRYVAS